MSRSRTRRRPPSRDAIHRYHDAFTLIELLIALGIMGILTSIVLVAINPKKQLCDAEDAARRIQKREVTNAIFQYMVGEQGLPAENIPVSEEEKKPVCKEGITGDATCVSLDALIPDYVAALPVDDSETNPNYTGYMVYLDRGIRPLVTSAYLGLCGEALDGGGATSSSISSSSSSMIGDPCEPWMGCYSSASSAPASVGASASSESSSSAAASSDSSSSVSSSASMSSSASASSSSTSSAESSSSEESSSMGPLSSSDSSSSDTSSSDMPPMYSSSEESSSDSSSSDMMYP